MKVEGVIFDLDNTLINRKVAFETYIHSFIDKFIVTVSQANRVEVIEYIKEADQNGYRSKRELYGELRRTLAMKNKMTTVEDLLEFWFSEFHKFSVLMEGAKEVLSGLKAKGILLGLITNGSTRSQNAKIDQVQIRNFFDTILVSDEVQIKKPDKRIFEMATERLNISPKNILYVGDHPINDIRGAVDAGLRAVWLKGFMDWDTSFERPEYTINNLAELYELINTFNDKTSHRTNKIDTHLSGGIDV